MSLVKHVGFDAAFTFVFSRRSGTKAAEMACQVSEEIKRERIVRLIDLQNSITEEKIKAYENTAQTVLVEGMSTRDKTHVCGRTDGGKMVNFAGDKELIGHFCNVRITKAKRTTLFGEICDAGEKGLWQS